MVQLVGIEVNVKLLKGETWCERCTSDNMCGWRGTWSFFNLSGRLSQQTTGNSQGISGFFHVNIIILNLTGWKGNLLICCVRLLSFLHSPGKYLKGPYSGNFSGFLVAGSFAFCSLFIITLSWHQQRKEHSLTSPFHVWTGHASH